MIPNSRQPRPQGFTLKVGNGKWGRGWILNPNALIYIPYPRVNCLKTIPFTAAHTYIAHIWQYPPPPALGLTHCFRLHTWPALAGYAGSQSLLRFSFRFFGRIYPSSDTREVWNSALAYRGPFSLKTFLEENSSAQARQLRRTIEFAGKHFVYGRSR